MIRPAPRGKTASLWMTHLRGSLIASVLTGLLVLSGLTSCAVNPATGGANLVLMSESREKEVGAEEHAKVLASQPVYQDEALLAYVTEVGIAWQQPAIAQIWNTLIRLSTVRPSMRWRCRVVTFTSIAGC